MISYGNAAKFAGKTTPLKSALGTATPDAKRQGASTESPEDVRKRVGDKTQA